MALFRSLRKRCFISHKEAQNAQKQTKNDQESALLTAENPPNSVAFSRMQY
jgi:hypothetical protein